MANVGTNFQWGKCQWSTSELTSSGGSANGQQISSEKKFLDIRGTPGTTWPSWVIASHSDITQKNISRKNFFGHSRHYWHYLTILSHCLTFWHHSKNILASPKKISWKKNFWAKKRKNFNRSNFWALRTNKQTDKLVVYIYDD
jgi:hypothetical protein